MSTPRTENAFTIDTSSIKFGAGITREAGYEMKRLGVKRAMLVTDPRMAASEAVSNTAGSLRDAKVDFATYDQVSVEPTDHSFKDAIQFAKNGGFDGFIPVGGGSSIDTAKAANLYSTYDTDFLEFVNAPIGKGTPIPGELKPLVAVPTTAGTGSETTGVAIFDFEELGAKITCEAEHTPDSESCKNKYYFFGQYFNKGGWYTDEVIKTGPDGFDFKKLEIAYQNCDGFKVFNEFLYDGNSYYLQEDSTGKSSSFYVMEGDEV